MKRLLLTFFNLIILATCGEASVIITKERETICLKADQASIADIVGALEAECGIRVSQGAWLQDKRFSLDVCESLEGLVRRVCRNVLQKSHALVFVEKRLALVYIAPDADQPSAAFFSLADLSRKSALPREVDAARVDKIMRGPSDSDLWEFQVNDLIISYNGKRITRGPLELVENMRKTKDYERIEVEVVRKGTIIKALVPGGILNISTVTQTISLDDLK